MSYEPTTWKDGDLVTSAKLNKLEQGIANGGILVVHVTGAPPTLDKTWQEIYDADLPIITGIIEDSKNWLFVDSAYVADGNYVVAIELTTYTAQTPNDYPIRDLIPVSELDPGNGGGGKDLY